MRQNLGDPDKVSPSSKLEFFEEEKKIKSN